MGIVMTMIGFLAGATVLLGGRAGLVLETTGSR